MYYHVGNGVNIGINDDGQKDDGFRINELTLA